jgi:hypothetical protein
MMLTWPWWSRERKLNEELLGVVTVVWKKGHTWNPVLPLQVFGILIET